MAPAAFIAADVAHVTDDTIFGESATWRGNTVVGIFDDEDIRVTLGEGVAQINPQAMFVGQASDFPGIADGDPMVIRGDAYTVKNWMRDGTGQIDVFVEKVQFG